MSINIEKQTLIWISAQTRLLQHYIRDYCVETITVKLLIIQ